MRISDWSSDVCSSDLKPAIGLAPASGAGGVAAAGLHARMDRLSGRFPGLRHDTGAAFPHRRRPDDDRHPSRRFGRDARCRNRNAAARNAGRSEEHTSELQSLMRISYAVFCLTKKKNTATETDATRTTKTNSKN